MRSVDGFRFERYGDTNLVVPSKKLERIPTPNLVPDANLGLPPPPPPVETSAMPFGQRLLAIGRNASNVVLAATMVGASFFLYPTTAAHAQTAECVELAADAESADEAEVRGKVCELVWSRYGGDPARAFHAYAGADGAIGNDELRRLLKDAGVGVGLTRGFWVDGVMDAFDGTAGTGKNDKIDWAEFARAME